MPNTIVSSAACNLGRLYLSYVPISRGKWRLWKQLNRVLREQSLPAGVRRLSDGNLINLDPDEAIDRFIYFWNQWEPNETWLIKKLLGEGATFVDVGANIGYFTLVAARRVGPAGSVIAIEASPPTVAKLNANIALNGYRNIVVHSCAAVERSSDTIRISRIHARNAGMNTIRPREGLEGWDVPCCRLDEILPDQPINLVKMDIEGAEMLALRGLEPRLRGPTAPDLVIEISPEYLSTMGVDYRAVFEFACALGYSAMEIKDFRVETLSDRQIATTPGMNAFFTKRNPLDLFS